MTKEELISKIGALEVERNAILSNMTELDKLQFERLKTINLEIATFSVLLEEKDGSK